MNISSGNISAPSSTLAVLPHILLVQHGAGHYLQTPRPLAVADVFKPPAMSHRRHAKLVGVQGSVPFLPLSMLHNEDEEISNPLTQTTPTKTTRPFRLKKKEAGKKSKSQQSSIISNVTLLSALSLTSSSSNEQVPVGRLALTLPPKLPASILCPDLPSDDEQDCGNENSSPSLLLVERIGGGLPSPFLLDIPGCSTNATSRQRKTRLPFRPTGGMALSSR